MKLDIQPADHAAWQPNWLQGDVLQAQLDFWKAYLADAPVLLELPTDRVRPPTRSFQGDHVAVTLSADLTASLRHLSQRHGTTLFATLLAGWAVLMSRLSGQHDIIVGTPVESRPYGELEPLIGSVVNALALRIRLQDNPSVADLLERIKTDTWQAFAHQEIPLRQIVDALQPQRDPGHSPIFQVMLALNAAPHEAALGVAVSRPQQAHPAAQLDLTLSLNDAGGTIQGNLEYATDLFDRCTIERLAGHLQTLLAGMVANEQQCVEHLPLLSEAEQRRLLFEFNDTAAPSPGERLIQQVFEEQVRNAPAAVAAIFEDRQLTYGELNTHANRLAHHLVALGVRPDDRVAICFERGLDMLVALLGVLKAGGAYLPLDPGHPAERLAYMLQNGAPSALLTQAALRDRLPAVAAPMVVLDHPGDISRLAQQPAHDPDPATLGLTSRNLAYVLYTSGSTGLPKGVMVEHRSVVNKIITLQGRFGLNREFRSILFAPLTFDPSVTQILMPLLFGGQVVVPTAAALLSPPDFWNIVKEKQVDYVSCVPSFIALSLSNMPDGVKVKHLVVAGERFPEALLPKMRRSIQAGMVHNIYGPTETCVNATCLSFTYSSPQDRMSIGKPMPNYQILILDRHRQPVPIGVAGEIYIGGAGVARGYLNRPELTEERFVPNPFSAAGTRLYKTGDLGRWLPDGNIEFLGRNDFQVKFRGFRIELGEIETRLATCPGVREAVVIVREDNPGDKRLVAYVTMQPGYQPSAAELRSHLAARLPDYMIPGAFITLKSLPLTPNGKPDRKALPPPVPASTAALPYEAPVGEVETAIASIWQTIFGMERVGRNDHFFFDLGGYSLLAVRMVALIKKQMGVDLPLATLFRAPSVASLSALLVQQRETSQATRAASVGAGWSPLVEITKASGRLPLFCFHGAHGNVLNFSSLAQQLGPDQPIFGLQARGTDGRLPVLNSIEEMAECYLPEIRRAQPSGPYHFLGYSAGGAIAFEVAQRLSAIGERVALLGLIDTGCPTAYARQLSIAQRLARGWTTEGLVSATRRFADRMLRYHLACQFAKRGRVVPQPLRDYYVATTVLGVYGRYRPRPYSGPITLFRATLQENDRISSADLGWGEYARGGVDIHYVAGTHGTMMYLPQVAVMAEQLRSSLEDTACLAA